MEPWQNVRYHLLSILKGPVINYGDGGGGGKKTGGGQVKFYPYKKEGGGGGGAKRFSAVEGRGGTRCEVVLTLQSVGGGAVLPCPEGGGGGGAKCFAKCFPIELDLVV